MAHFGLIESFHIDNGELDGLSPQECFVLGYELAQIGYLLALSRKPIAKPVHAANRDRIEAKCKASGREYRIDWMPEDKSESWVMLSVR